MRSDAACNDRERAEHWTERRQDNHLTSTTILVVVHKASLAVRLRRILQGVGFQVLLAYDGLRGFEMVRKHRPDLVLLDVLVPTLDGWETCRSLRQVSNVPIILLGSDTDPLERVRGLELGANDFVDRAWGDVELLARIRATLRGRTPRDAMDGLIRIDDRLALDRGLRQAIVDGNAVELSATEFRLLCCLLDNAGRICTHHSLLTQVWGWDCTEETDYVKVHICKLRKKIEPDPRNPRYIFTERGLGYRFRALPPFLTSFNPNPDRI
jgi:DNA-binding response OmpR family regulator